MNNKFSDIDKVIITAWLFFGAGVGAFVAPLFRVSFMIAGGIGLFAGAIVAYVLFFEPWRRQYGLFSYSKGDDTTEEENDETESDISEFIRASFEAEGTISQDDVVFNNMEGNDSDTAENNEVVSEEETDENDMDSSELEEDIEDSNDEIEETELEEYETDNDSSEEDSEKGGSQGDENLEEEDELEKQDVIPAFYGSRNQIHSSYDKYKRKQSQVFKAWITPTQLPITLAKIWFFISVFIGNNPKFMKTIFNFFSVSFFTLLPILFLIGLSGLIGILFREPSETLETSAEENTTYRVNLLKIFGSWGIGIYAILVNL